MLSKLHSFQACQRTETSSRTSSLFNGTLLWTKDPSLLLGPSDLVLLIILDGFLKPVCCACSPTFHLPDSYWALVLIPSTPSSGPYNHLTLLIPTGLTHPLVPSAASTLLHLGKTDLAWALGHLRSKSGEQNWNSQALGRNIYYEKYQRICVFTYFNYFWKNWTQVCFCALAYLYFILLRAKKK